MLPAVLALLCLGAGPARAQLDPHVGGQWSGILPWPHIAVSMASLPDGRILTFSSNERDSFPVDVEFTYAAVWDPETGVHSEIPHPSHDMFCASLVTLEDGEVFVTGGRNKGLSPFTSIFDFRTDSWIPMEDMNRGRWYPTSIALPNGQVFVAVGTGGQQYPEIWTPGSGWQLLTGIDLTDPILQYGSINGGDQWPLMHLDLDGNILHYGATPIMHSLDLTGLGSITTIGPHNAPWHAKEAVAVMYDEAKLLVAGGATAMTDVTSVANAMTIDISGPAPVITQIAPMNSPRQYHNEVILPDGRVIVIGGNTNGEKFVDTSAVLAPEVWDPDTGVWTLWNPQQVPRVYHSTAILMTDGRIISAGGGLRNLGSEGDHLDAEIFSPPYLFDALDQPAVRPVITDAPGLRRIGTSFGVEATAGLSRFTLIKMSATTHTQNTDLRFLEVPFSEDAPGEYTLTLHSDENVLTPGYWMLWALDAQDVPSEAHVIQIVTTGRPRAPIPADPRNRVGDVVSLQIEAADPDGDPLNFGASGLPDGLAIDPATGLVTGVPTTPGIFNVDVLVDDGVDSVAVAFRWFVATPQVHSEIGSVTVAQADSDEWHAVSFGDIFVDPIVVMGPPTRSDSAPVTVRVRDVTPTGFEFQIDEWDYLDGAHGSETLAWMAVDAGAHVLDTGEALVAGVTEFVDHDWKTQDLPAGAFSVTPLVLAQIVTSGHPEAAVDRLQNVGSGSFEVKLQEQEKEDGLIGAEKIHWIAIEPGVDSGGVVADLTGPAVDHDPYTLDWTPDFSGAPQLLATAQTYLSYNPMAMRMMSTSAASTDIFCEEETSKDTELAHSQEDIGYLAADPTVSGLSLSPLFNDPPTIDDPGDQTSEQGTAIAPLMLVVNDLDGDPVTFGAAGLPDGLAIDPLTGVISGTPTTPGVSTVTVTVTDQPGASADAVFDWTINEELSLAQTAAPPQAAGDSVSLSVVPSWPGAFEYVWDFGDGTPPTDPSPLASATHTYAGPGRWVVTVTVTDPSSGASDVLQFEQVIHPVAAGTPPAQSSSIVYEAAADRVWTVNPDNDSVSVFDATTDLKVAEVPLGDEPSSLAIASDGFVWVVEKGAARISLIDPVGPTLARHIELPRASRPDSLVFSHDGLLAYVSLEATGELLEIDALGEVVLASVDVGPNPRALALTPDGATLLVSRFVTLPLPGESTDSPATEDLGQPVGGEVIPVDTATLVADPSIVLEHSYAAITQSSGPGVPNYVGVAAIAPDGASAWVPSKQDNILGGAARSGIDLGHDSTVRAVSSHVDLTTLTESLVDRVDHDDASVANSARFDATGAYVFTTLESTRAVAVIDPFGKAELGRFAAGRAPRGTALSPDGRTLYVHNFMDRTVTVHDLSQLLDYSTVVVPTVATWSLVASESLAADVFAGKQFFYDAFDPRLALQGYMSCASCHNGGGHDGRTWDFTQFGEGLRNTIDLTGHGQGHGPLHWTANFDEVQDFEGQIRMFAGGTGLMADVDFYTGTRSDPLGDPKAGISADLDALAAYVQSLTSAYDSPYRMSDGSLTAEAQEGRTLFLFEGCADCHSGTAFSDSGTLAIHDVGTLTPASGPVVGLDTPTLRGLWYGAPYLHDGSAATLEEAVAAHSGVALDAYQLGLLAAYLEQIDDDETQAPSVGAPSKCGLGSELAIALPGLLWLRRRRQRARARG